jgi:hypothetical protein
VGPTVFSLKLSSGPNMNRGLIIVGSAPAYTLQWAVSGPGRRMSLTAGKLSVQNDPTAVMYVRMSTSSYGLVFMATAAYVASSSYTWTPVTCSVDGSTLALSCSTPSGLTRLLQCGSTVYMANADFTPGGCVEVGVQAVV